MAAAGAGAAPGAPEGAEAKALLLLGVRPGAPALPGVVPLARWRARPLGLQWEPGGGGGGRLQGIIIMDNSITPRDVGVGVGGGARQG